MGVQRYHAYVSHIMMHTKQMAILRRQHGVTVSLIHSVSFYTSVYFISLVNVDLLLVMAIEFHRRRIYRIFPPSTSPTEISFLEIEK